MALYGSILGMQVEYILVRHIIIRAACKRLNLVTFCLCRTGRSGKVSRATTLALRIPVKTQGEIEAAVCEGMARFEQEYMGRGPTNIHAHLIGDLLVVRLQGVLTAAEKQLVKSLSSEKGRDLLKQVRTQLIETARPVMETMIQEATGIKVLSMHHDISTLTGEEVVLFTLAGSPLFRDAKKK